MRKLTEQELREGKYGGVDLTFSKDGYYIMIEDDDGNEISIEDDWQWEEAKSNFDLTGEEISMIDKGYNINVEDAIGMDMWGSYIDSNLDY